MAAPSARVLGPYERFILARSNIGSPLIPVYAALLDAPIDLDAAKSAVNILLLRYPLLSCCIPDALKPSPRWILNTAIHATDVIRVVDSAQDLPSLLSSQVTINVHSGPLWLVTLYTGNSPALVLHMHHVLSDGVGSKNLLVEVLQLIANPTAEVRPTPFPPTLEASVNCRPRWTQMCYLLFMGLFVPILPMPFRGWLSPRAIWPNPPRLSPQDQEPRIALIRLSSATIHSLKEAAQQHGVSKLHAMLLALAIYATWAMSGSSEDVPFACSSPASERAAELGHPACTGNYISSYKITQTLSSQRPFWALARQLAALFASPAERARSRGLIGTIAYIPNTDKLNARGRTGLDELLEQSVVQGTDFEHTFDMSNLGVVPQIAGVKELAWSHKTFSGMVSQAIHLNALTIEGGPMNLSINWRDGVLSDAEISAFKTAFEQAVDRLVQKDIPGDAAFKDLITQHK